MDILKIAHYLKWKIEKVFDGKNIMVNAGCPYMYYIYIYVLPVAMVTSPHGDQQPPGGITRY